MTTQGSESIMIEASPEAVWPWVARLEKHPEWSPQPYRVELVSGEPETVGCTYRSVGVVPGDKNHANEVEVSEVVPGRRFALRAHDENGYFENSFDLQPSGTGTEVTFKLVFPQMKGVTKFLLPVLFPIVGKSDMRKRMALLKAKVESGA